MMKQYLYRAVVVLILCTLPFAVDAAKLTTTLQIVIFFYTLGGIAIGTKMVRLVLQRKSIYDPKLVPIMVAISVILSFFWPVMVPDLFSGELDNICEKD